MGLSSGERAWPGTHLEGDDVGDARVSRPGLGNGDGIHVWVEEGRLVVDIVDIDNDESEGFVGQGQIASSVLGHQSEVVHGQVATL